MNPELIIFDCDGVLVDSEIVVHRVMSEEMSNIDFPLTVERSIELFSGAADEDFSDIISKEYNRAISDYDLTQIIGKIKSAFQDSFDPIEEISSIINYLNQNQIGKCIASNSLYDDIINSLSLAGIGHYFDEDRIFSVSMVEKGKGKPEPDLFLHAAENFNVSPKDCLVIEDSLVGITAAKAAKMPVIGFLGATHANNSWYVESVVKAKPDLIAHDASELLDALRTYSS